MLKNYLWEIFQCAHEECNDGDNFNPDLSTAPNIFVEGVKGNPEHQYKALDALDTAAIKAKWEALDAASQAKEYDEVDAICDKNYKELCAAFNAGDREKFMAIVNG